MTPLDDEALARLEAAALATDIHGDEWPTREAIRDGADPVYGTLWDEDCAYIAEASPIAVLAIIAEVRRLRAVRDATAKYIGSLSDEHYLALLAALDAAEAA